MKEILLSVVLLCCSLYAKADGRVYVYGEPGDYYFGMLNRVSDNGRWAVGADDGYQTGSYIIDTERPDVLVQVKGGELYDVTDDGMAVGAWYENQGSETEPIYYARAATYSNGQWHRLPVPDDCSGRSYARSVSPDARYIGGMAFCKAKDSEMGGKYYPCLWTRDDDGSYRVTAYNGIKLPGNMGFFAYDMTADGNTMAGLVCTDAGGTVPALLRNGELVCWNNMEWKEHAFNLGGSTENYYAGFVDGVLEGTTERDWFAGAFNYISGDYVYGHRTVATNVDAERGTGTLTHYRTVYNMSTGEFCDHPGQSYYSCGYDAGRAFMVSGMTGYYTDGATMAKVARALNATTDVDIAAVYSCDKEGRVFACSMVWLNEAIGEYCESPVLMILDKGLSEMDDTPSVPSGTGASKSFTLSPNNGDAVAALEGVVTLSFPTVNALRLSGAKAVKGKDGVEYALSFGDRPNELKLTIQPTLTESGVYTFTIPEGTLVDVSANTWLPEVRFDYTVDASLADAGRWTITPSLDQPIQQLDGTYTITLTNYKRIEWENSLIPCRVYIYKGGDTGIWALTSYDATVNQNTITFTAKPGLYEAGDYVITVSGYINAADKSEIPDFNIPFTLTGGTPPDDPGDRKPTLDQTYMLAPDNHAPLPELSGKIVITFPGVKSFADIGGFPTITTPSGEKLGVFEDGTVIRVKAFAQLDGGDYISNAGYIDLDAVGLRFTDPGEYTISIPKSVFHVDGDYDKDYVDPFTFTYTVGYPSTVLFDESFDGDYTTNFPFVYDFDSKEPASAIRAWFLSADQGVYMPWWVLRESSADTDRFIGSHSYYSTPAQSDDWFVSRPVTIAADNYRLSFEAQSVVLRDGDRLSDLELYISEQPVTAARRPESPTAVYEQVPCGNSKDVTTGEWTRYELPLAEWVGKTVHLCFANRNTDRDLLCINNVRIYRNEPVEVAFGDMPDVTADETVTVAATVTAVEDDLDDYSAVFVCHGQEIPVAEALEPIAKGEARTFTAQVSLEPCVPATIVFRLVHEGTAIERTGNITRLAFRPDHRVLIEETTGLWCGNCPIGTYSIESLKDDENISANVIPVSVHIKGGTSDLMVTDATTAYADYLGLGNVAPMTRIDRGANAIGFTTAYDTRYDPDNAHSFAHRVYDRRDQLSLFDIEVEAVPVINQGDTVAFNCTALVRPALDLDPGQYRVGFILTENNVGMDDRGYWAQHNYFSGYAFESKLGGWTELPDVVQNLRYHYVARALSAPGGIEGSFTELKATNEYRVAGTVTIPDTYATDRKGDVASMAVRPYMCEITAYIVDGKDLSIQNSARVPITDQALDIYTVADYLANGIRECSESLTGNPGVYDLQGRRTTATSRGLYIVNGKKVVM